MTTTFQVGGLVQARGREWVVLPQSEPPKFLVLRPLGGSDDEVAGVFPALEQVSPAVFEAPDPGDAGTAASAGLLRTALRIGFRASAGPFRSLARLAVEPRAYQLVPLLVALRQDTVRLLIADDVGIGKTVEAGLIGSELLEQGDATGLAVLCGPALAEQWQRELATKFGIHAELVLPGTIRKLERGLLQGETLFDRYPHIVVSTDFIKRPGLREQFWHGCPDLLIIDEAHTCVSDGTGGRSRMLRHELVKGLAKDAQRHLILVTATPHSGKEEQFRNLLALLQPNLEHVDLDAVQGRDLLARHFVQRRRGDIRVYIDETTPFPEDRLSQERSYSLSQPYEELFDDVLQYARETVRDPEGGKLRQRVRYWSALALLRALASSPRAAAATLRTRAANLDAQDEAEADRLGRSAVLDLPDEETVESADATPGADGDAAEGETPHRRRLRRFAARASQLEGQGDTKLTLLGQTVTELLLEGYNPIVFCRFIDTAEYVAEHLAQSLGADYAVTAVTGVLPPDEREARIKDLASDPGKRPVLVATDCLSEGVNLQEHFQAVVHYDLAWNPTRHEQREGRVDRFGQQARIVRAVMLYGADNGIDGIVLNVLLRKHEQIRKALGISVPVPDRSDDVVQAILEGLLLRDAPGEQLAFEGIGLEKRTDLHREWDSAVAREHQSRTKYRQAGIQPAEVARELVEMRASLGTPAEVADFTREALSALRADISPLPDGFRASTGPLPAGLRDALVPGHAEPLPFHRDLPVPYRDAYLDRTDPNVAAIARYVLESALDPLAPAVLRPARRCGVMRTAGVSRRTTLLLVRFRMHLELPGRDDRRQVVAEDAQVLAYRGRADSADWLTPDELQDLLTARPVGNIPPDQAEDFAERAVADVTALSSRLDDEADTLATRLREDHIRVREAGGQRVRRQITVSAQKPADILGVYVYLPRRERVMTEFGSLKIVGGLLPADLLGRVFAGDPQVPGTSPQTYGLERRESVRRQASRSWLYLLEVWQDFKQRIAADDAATSARVTRERWLRILLRELGFHHLTAGSFEIEGKSFPVSHQAGHVPVHLLGWGTDLDHKTPHVTARAPQSMLQELLNRDDAYLWAVVSNGGTLRLLRDSAALTGSAYVEFDLEAVFDGELFSDFVLLYLACHESRFAVQGDGGPASCYLEQWRGFAADQGQRALDQLRTGVEQAIAILGTGFLSHPNNPQLRIQLGSGELKLDDLNRALLRVVYRMLFWFVAEERRVLLQPDPEDADESARRRLREARQRYDDYFSSARLRQLARRRRGDRHSDLFEALQLVFDALGTEGGVPELALPGIGGIFETSRDDGHALPLDEPLAGARLSNEALLGAVRALSLVKPRDGGAWRRVDFGNLGAEELGSVYESLLELIPRYDEEQLSYTLETLAGNERKETGSYYTPTSLVECLLDSALDPKLDEACAHGTAEERVTALLALTVCDPACGSGHFLVAAARRIAKRAAAEETGDPEPPEAVIRAALRRVVGRCIYGVDVNPMAAELAKVSLWLEALDPGKPLSYLDQNIRVGNSLLGVTPALLADGLPDEAFKPIEGDNRKVCSALKKQNAAERHGQHDLFTQSGIPVTNAVLAKRADEITHTLPESLEDLHIHQERQADQLAASAERRIQKLLADAWCAAFVQPKTDVTRSTAITHAVLEQFGADADNLDLAQAEQLVTDLTRQYRFFHWHVEFPHIFRVGNGHTNIDSATGWVGGFSCVIGNPPWDQVQLDPQEFFASRNPAIAEAPNMAIRDTLISTLVDDDPVLYAEYEAEQRRNDGMKHFLHASGLFPLTSYGRLNTYSLFAEMSRSVISAAGSTGLILPTGIATDSFNQYFFRDLVSKRKLFSFLDFENEAFLLSRAVHHSVRFCLLTVRGRAADVELAAFAFGTRYMRDLPVRRFAMPPEEILLVNPNTGTAPVFRSRRDAEITISIYKRVPVLLHDEPEKNLWDLSLQLMFMSNTDSSIFRTRKQLEHDGWTLEGNVFIRGSHRMLPLYEAKMIHHFDHRFGTYDGQTKAQANMGTLPRLVPEQHDDPGLVVIPRYWVDKVEVDARLARRSWDKNWLLGWRDICRSSDERTMICSVLPRTATPDGTLVMLPIGDLPDALVANLSSFVFDYVVRQKSGGTHLKFFTIKQLPVLPPSVFQGPIHWLAGDRLSAWIRLRVLELTYTAYDITPFAVDLRDGGPPFRWDEERRLMMRAELDAAFFHLYEIERDDVDYIMETFPVVKKRGEQRYGTFRTKELILEIYDAMTEAARTGKRYQTILDPPPGQGPRHG